MALLVGKQEGLSRYMNTEMQKSTANVSRIARKRKLQELQDFEEGKVENRVGSSPERVKCSIKRSTITGGIKGFRGRRASLTQRIALKQERLEEDELSCDDGKDKEEKVNDYSSDKDRNHFNEPDSSRDKRRTERRKATWSNKMFKDGFFYGYWTDSEDDEHLKLREAKKISSDSNKIKRKSSSNSNEIKMKRSSDSDEVKIKSSDANEVKTKRSSRETREKSDESRKSSFCNSSSLSHNSSLSVLISKSDGNTTDKSVTNMKVKIKSLLLYIQITFLI